MGNPTVHYFSLDIEGAEIGVLKTIPWDQVDIWVLSVETHMAGQVFPGTRDDIIDYMKSVGYRSVQSYLQLSFIVQQYTLLASN